MTRWNSVASTKNSNRWQRLIPILIGLLIFLGLMLLCGCVRTQYEYREVEREPIDCDMRIETPLDMANCLAEFRQKW